MKRLTLLLFMTLSILSGNSFAKDRKLFVVKSNPHPDELPTLGVWQQYVKKSDTFDTLLSASFPNVPDFTCDLWCFESPGVVFESARELKNGQVELRHSWENYDWEILTIATPRPGALEIVAHLVTTSDDSKAQPQEYPSLNICWQLRRAAQFASKPDPYPEFVRRCFIVSEQGCVFLLDTQRRAIPVRSSTDEENNPPWVQMYAPLSAPADLQVDSTNWADYSPDRYRLPVIGAVSRDRRYLAAIASGAETIVCQAWHDCMHNNPGWLPSSDKNGKQWRVMIYAMENDPEALFTRFHEDFPKIASWK